MKRKYLGSLVAAIAAVLALSLSACGHDNVNALQQPTSETTISQSSQEDVSTPESPSTAPSVSTPSLSDISDNGLASSSLQPATTATYNGGCYVPAKSDGTSWNEMGDIYDAFTDSASDSGEILAMKSGNFDCYDRLVIDMKTPFLANDDGNGMLASSLQNIHCFASECTYRLKLAALVSDPTVIQQGSTLEWFKGATITEQTDTTTTLELSVAEDVTARVNYLTRDGEEYMVIDFAPKPAQN